MRTRARRRERPRRAEQEAPLLSEVRTPLKNQISTESIETEIESNETRVLT